MCGMNPHYPRSHVASPWLRAQPLSALRGRRKRVVTLANVKTHKHDPRTSTNNLSISYISACPSALRKLIYAHKNDKYNDQTARKCLLVTRNIYIVNGFKLVIYFSNCIITLLTDHFFWICDQYIYLLYYYRQININVNYIDFK